MASVGSKLRRERKGRSKRRFIQLWTNVKRSEAYHSLSVYGRSALIELLDRYTGINNGMIGLGVRGLAVALDCSNDAAARALRELDDSGLARPVTGGLWKGKRATEWRLTFYVCNKTGELPITSWPAHAQVYDEADTKVRLEGHKASKCPSGRTHKPKNSISDPAKCPPGSTHIDIYHSPDGLGAHPEQASEQAQANEAQRASEQAQPNEAQRASEPDPIWEELDNIPPGFERRPSRLARLAKEAAR
jgi:hypothetical protein